MPQRMRISRAGIELIKSFEGFTPRTMRIDNERWVIGYGHIRTDKERYRVSRDEAEQILKEYDLPPYEQLVLDHTYSPLHQGAFDALVSFAFNIGKDAFLASDVLSLLNAGETLAAAEAMGAWRKAKIKGRTIVVDALVRRRAAEKAMFLSDPGGPAPAPSAVVRPKLDPTVQISTVRDRTVIVESKGDGEEPKSVSYQPNEERRSRSESVIAAPRPMERLTRRFEEALSEGQQATPKSAPKPAPQIVDPNAGPTPEEITAAISELVNGAAEQEDPQISEDLPGIDLDDLDSLEDGLEPYPEDGFVALDEARGETTRFERTLGEELEPIELPEIDEPLVIDDLETVEVDDADIERAVRLHEEMNGSSQREHVRNWGPFAFLAIIGAGLFAWGMSLLGENDPSASGGAISFEIFLIILGALLFVVMAYYFVREFIKSGRI